MRIVVTGGCGFIGSSFVNLCVKNGIDVLVVDKLTYAANKDLIPNLSDGCQLLVKDICDVTSEDLGEYEYLVNFAAESHVDNSIENGLPFVRTNVEGTFNLLELARKNPKLKKFVQISTDEVYGDMESRGLPSATEDTSLQPSSYYSATKASADQLVISAGRTYGLPFLITRTCNNYGINQHHEKFLPTIAKSIKENTPVPLYGDGGQLREWIWVEDNVRLISELMFKAKGIYNIGSGDEWSNRAIINQIGLVLKQSVNYEHVEDRKGHDRRYTVNTNKLELFLKNYNLTTKNLEKYLTETFG